MSERGSFTSEYIYDLEDYATIRAAITNAGIRLAPPAMNGDYEIPIVQGKVEGMTPDLEWWDLVESVIGVKTNGGIRFVVLCECGGIQFVEKKPNGCTLYSRLVKSPEEKRIDEELLAQKRAEEKQAWWIFRHGKYQIKRDNIVGTRKRGD